MKIIALYKTDNQHSYASRDLIALCTDKEAAIDVIAKKADKEGHALSDDDVYNLNNISQTQNYGGEGEFHFEQLPVNKLI